MKTKNKSIFYSAFCLAAVLAVATAQTYSCPGLSQNPVVIPADSGNSFTRQINKSTSNTVCVLVRVSARTDNANLNNIRRTSLNEDYFIVPVARSYNNRKWERVAGPYAQDLSITNCCNINIPNLPNLPTGKFVLMSFTYQPSNKESVARFFQQTTFGPKLSMINDWNYNNDITSEMSKWMKSQMDEGLTPPTSHRAFYRERVDSPTEKQNAHQYARPRHPCAKYARWREYSFTAADYGKEIVVTRWNGQFLISVDGHPRTLRSTWKHEDTGVNIGTGTFGFCWHTDGFIGGEVWIYDPITTDCYLIYNNRPNLPGNLQDSSFREVSLPNKASGFVSIDPISSDDYAFYIKYGGGLYLNNQLNNADCSGIDDNGVYQNVIGVFPNGQQAYYEGNIVLDENTLENPIADGGATMMNMNITGYDYWTSEPQCPVAFKSFVNIDSCYLSTTSANACSPSWTASEDGNRVVVCGSPSEVANDPTKTNTFVFPYNTNIGKTQDQKKIVWSMIALNKEDQLRQRMAWALSQILVVTPKQINEEQYSEIYLNYYDIFVRNAFGNYFDILKEVSYSPMMAEMLSYLDSKSSAWVLEETGAKSYPDENYAREIMQLFSIGLYQLNVDGTNKLDGAGNSILSYDNTDIQNFARAWTGFRREYRRSNIELEWWDWDNRLDTMKVRGEHRDPFPKMDLGDGFIGDKVPLCVDLPSRHFLKKGAQYRLLGSSPQPELHEYGWQWNEWDDWFEGPTDGGPLWLGSSSNLRNKLRSNNDIVVTLDSDLACTGNECNVDSLGVVQVQRNPPLYYEYLRPPCVELAFYDDAKKITSDWDKSMCGNPKLDSAFHACCEDPNASYPMGAGSYCLYDFERTTQSTARNRCQSTFEGGDLCHFYWVSSTDTCTTSWFDWWMQDKWYWTDEECTVQAKVNEDGNVAIIHIPPLQQDHPDEDHVDKIDLRVHPDNTNYFKVKWDSADYPKPSNSCGNGVCLSTYRGCLCDIDIVESRVFNSLPSVDQIINNLHIGSADPLSLDSYSQVPNTGNNIKVWHKNGGSYDKNTVFSVTYRGKETFLKNMKSTVRIAGATQFKFRNPPSFMNLGFREKRDAMYETDAVLETYFWNDNVGPFLALRLIQRFGISNPSPRYVEAVATAFQEGTYANPDQGGTSFGDGKYGNLEAMVAAIVLDPEATSTVLDADPTSGSLVEPMLKLTRLLRAMEFEPRNGERIRLENLQQKIGQEPHGYPSVFSFFRPEYTAPGHIKAASITSPEAQVMTGPKVINFLNGIISLIDLGLNDCFSGLGQSALWWCEGLENYYSEDEYNFGQLQYSPTGNSAANVVDELSLLLTAGRLGSASTDIIKEAYNGESDAADGLRLAQKLIASSPEFHSTSVFHKTTTNRPDVENPTSSNREYKAVVFLMLDGGSDSHNMLVPHSGCSGGKTSYDHYASVRGQIAVPKADLLQIDASSSSQVCSTFGVHPNLPHLKTLYDDGDLLWMANVGVLQQFVTEDNWWELTDETALFAHNIQQDEVHNVDIYENQVGRGVGGRMADILKKNGYSSASVSVAGIADFVVSGLAATFTLDPWSGVQKLNPMTWAQPLWNTIKRLNSASNIGSNLFGETWSNTLFKAVGENELLKGTLDATTLDTTFPSEDYELAPQLELVSKLIKSKDTRGVERDIFYVELGGFDTHDNIKEFLDERTTTMNAAVQAFTTEMKAQNAWNDVTLVMVSEFARTLPGNTGAGSDHAWGGNYFVAGGEVRGKRIIGEYPDVLSEDGSLIFEPGIVIPTKSWDAPWNAISQWLGITSTQDLDEVLPNRNTFPNDLFNQNDLYTTGPAPTPTAPTPTAPTPTAPTPTAPTPTAPTPTPPTGGSSCEDSPFRFKVTKTDGNIVARDCTWVANKATNSRCKLVGVSSQCPSTCNSCSPCIDSVVRFKFEFKDKGKITRDCGWVARKNTSGRCKVDGMEHTCRVTCNNC